MRSLRQLSFLLPILRRPLYITYSLRRFVGLFIVEERASRWSWRAACCSVRRRSSRKTPSSFYTPHIVSTATCSRYDLSISIWRLSWIHTATRPCRGRRTSTSTLYRNRLLSLVPRDGQIQSTQSKFCGVIKLWKNIWVVITLPCGCLNNGFVLVGWLVFNGIHFQHNKYVPLFLCFYAIRM